MQARTDPQDEERHILGSWQTNADAWTEAVRGRMIESRRLVTDAAVVEAVCSRSPRFVLDLGCGEGWLARALHARGIEVSGVDAEPRLIEAARGAGGGLFQVGTYQSLAQLPDAQRRGADAVVCNFSLFGDASVTALFACVARLLRPGGSFIVQTLHPLEASRDAPYRDAWRQGSWDGFSSQFSDPAPWYFRTLESWTRLHADNGLVLQEMREPLHPRTGRPASVIFLSATAAS